MPATMVENPTPVVGLGGGSRPSSGHDGSEQEWEVLAMEAEEEDVYLRELAGVDSLEQASSLQILINTTTSTVSHLGAKLSSLQELNLNNSVIASLRDLGTGFKCLTVLWVSRCGLAGLEGLTAMPALRELYASFNDISDLQPLDACCDLEVLDLEGNCVAGLDCAVHLSACTSLQSLNLTGNPVTELEGYRQQLCSVLPSLLTLDDVDVEESERVGLPAGGSTDGAAGSTSAAPSASQETHAEAASELAIVWQGIKHARVGVDSQEFQKLEMAMLLEGSGGGGEGNGPGGCVLQTAGSDGCIMSGAVAGSRPCTASPIMPLSAGTWIRALRSSQAGSLAALRVSREAAGGCANGGPGRPGSAGSMGHSPGSSRPQTAQGAGGEAGGAAGGAGPGGIPRPVSASMRPFSARLGSAALGGAGAGGVRPGTGASAPPTAGGLYWRKHRLNGPASASATDSLLDAVAAVGEQEEGSSTLTFGGDAIGGSLARDLRRRRKAGLGSTSAVAAVAAGSGSRPASGPAAGDGGASLNRNQSSGPFGGGVSTSYDTAALLDELRRWKVETADRALSAEEGPSDGAWGAAMGSVSGSDAGAACPSGPGLHVDILDLGREAHGPMFSLSDEMTVGGDGGAGAGPCRSSHTGSAGAEDRDSGGGTGLARGRPSHSQPQPQSHTQGSTVLTGSGSLSAREQLGAPPRSTSPPLPTPKSPARSGCAPGSSHTGLAPVHVPPGTRSAHRTMLAKVVRDVSGLSACSPSIAGPRAGTGRAPSARTREEGHHSSSLGRPPSAGGPSSPLLQRSPSHSLHTAQAAPGGTPTRQQQHLAPSGARPTSGRDGGGSSAAVAGGEGHGQPSRPDSGRYHVTCVVGELDLAAANPRPIMRQDQACDSDEEGVYE